MTHPTKQRDAFEPTDLQGEAIIAHIAKTLADMSGIPAYADSTRRLLGGLSNALLRALTNRQSESEEVERAYREGWSDGKDYDHTFDGNPEDEIERDWKHSRACFALTNAGHSAKGGEWLPIESAPPYKPMGGSIRLLVCGNFESPREGFYTEYADGRKEWSVRDYPHAYKPTHWMPLPTPPETEAE